MKKILSLFLLTASFTLNAQIEAKELKINENLIGDLYKTDQNKETVILLIAGSGPTDRNGNTLGIAENNSLKFLAEDLASKECGWFNKKQS